MSYLIALAIVAIIVVAYVYAKKSGVQLSIVTPPVPPVVVDTSKPSLRQIGTGDDSVAAVLYTQPNYAGDPQVLDPNIPVTICQQRGGQLTWLFQSLKLNPGAILEINGQVIDARYFKGIAFLAVGSNIPNLTTLATVYPSIKGNVWNNLDSNGTWAQTGPSLFATATSASNIDYTIKLVSQTTAVQDAQSALLDCNNMASVYGCSGDVKTLTCALPDPIGTLNLGSIPTVGTVRNYVTPGLV